jgi:hypothetical protein
MRLNLLSPIVLAGLLSVPVLHEAGAAPVTTAAPRTATVLSGNTFEKIYYYHGHHYPYAYRGHYYNHRYYRHNHWHYY